MAISALRTVLHRTKARSRLVIAAIALLLPVGEPIQRALASDAVETRTRLPNNTMVMVHHHWLAVPRLREDPGRGTFLLSYSRLLTSETPPDADPVVFLSGGPGDWSTKLIRNWRYAPTLTAVLRHRPVVLLDQRGTGKSDGQLRCSTMVIALPLEPAPGPTARLSAYRRLAEACMSEIQARGLTGSMFTTQESANDVGDLIQALGVERAILFGVSYGSHLALSVLRTYPDRVAGAILFGVEGPDHTVKTIKQTQDWLHAVEVESGAAITEAFEEAMARLALKPSVALPRNSVVSPGKRVQLEPADLLIGLYGRMSSRRVGERTKQYLQNVAAGYLGELAREAAVNRYIEIRRPLPYLVDCASGASRERQRSLEEQKQEFKWAWLPSDPLPAVCSVFENRLSNEFRSELSTRVPLLMVSGALDGKTPPSNAREVAASASDAQLITVPGVGHSWSDAFTRSKILRQQFEEFLEDAY